MMKQQKAPVVFRIAGAILIVSAAGGQVWQRQPAGPATYRIFRLVERHCPAALPRAAGPTVADGARAIDAWSSRVLLDIVDGDDVSRCEQGEAAERHRNGRARRSPEGEMKPGRA